VPLAATFRSLQSRNYRLWFTGQLVSVAGTWTQTIAQGWLVLQLSNNSGVAVGTVTALQYLPTLVLGLWGGLLADRLDKRTLLLGSQLVLGAVAGMLAAVDLAGVVELWMVYALVTLSGVASAVEQPARQSFVVELVGPDDLANAIGLNSTIFNSARMVGPAIAGVLIVTVGTGACFLVNAVSYLATFTALVLMRPAELHRESRVAKGRGQIREGLRYAWSVPVLRANLLLMTAVGTLAFNFPVVLPLLAKVTFDGGAGSYSLLTAAQGAGALAGALTIASMRRTDGRRVVLAAVAMGVAMCGAALAPSLAILVLVMPTIGLGQIFVASSSNALIQLDAAPAMRGRVTSIRTITVLGSTPIGGLIAGGIGQTAGPRWAMAMGGAACLLGALAFGAPLFGPRRGRPTTPTPTEPDVDVALT
jgi:MFS family permease